VGRFNKSLPALLVTFGFTQESAYGELKLYLPYLFAADVI